MQISSTGLKRVLYSRDVDGSLPVHVYRHGVYKLHTVKGIKTFTSKRQLLIALTKHPKARNWTFARYFRLTHKPYIGKPVVSILDGLIGGTVATVSPSELGIDLVARSHEVAKLLFKGFGSWIYTNKYDPQDVLQEVYKGILIRNLGKCPWDARKSSFGHYVHMVCNSIMSNFHRKKKRTRSCEATGILGYTAEGDWGYLDVAESSQPAPPTGEVQRCGILEATDDLLGYMPDDSSTHLARQVLPLLRDGYTRTDIARIIGVRRTLVMRAVIELQEWAVKWHHIR